VLRKIRRAFAARYLFDNWYSLLIKYVFAKVGLKVKLKARIDGCIHEVTPEGFARLVSRYYRGLINDLECKDSKVFLNGVEVSNINEVIYSLEKWAEVFGWIYDSSCNCWTKDNIRFRYMRESILAIFEYGGWYEKIDVKDRVVVDVGAYIGDSAIYFASRGARKVVALEPHPGAYEEMLENIRLNSLENIIFPINAGLASRPGKILLEEVDVETTNVTYYKPNDRKGSIPAVTLQDLIKRFDLNNAILKMNCEGCEYDVILNDYEHVKTFDELIFQYHAFTTKIPVKLLLEKLSEGFTCEMLSDEKFYRKYGGNQKLHGLVKCTKNSRF